MTTKTIRSLARRFQVSTEDVAVLVDQIESDGETAFTSPMTPDVSYYDLPLTAEATEIIKDHLSGQ